jgi:hypothetical protein
VRCGCAFALGTLGPQAASTLSGLTELLAERFGIEWDDIQNPR